MQSNGSQGITRGQWMALMAAFLGWMFDGLEMGLFPLVARPALRDLLPGVAESDVGKWFAVATATFLVGAATGGVLFGWLGDRIGRVRAMMFSILTYALFSGACGLATSPLQIAFLRFLSALGMGGEWSLGVALVMEIWPDKSRALLAGLIGAAANVGFILIAFLSLVLNPFLEETGLFLSGLGMPDSWVAALVGHSGWRLLMMMGALPALLTFFIRMFVPESERWQEEQSRGSVSHWASRDLLAVVIGAVAALAIVCLWAPGLEGQDNMLEVPLGARIAGSLLCLVVVLLGYVYPVVRYLYRSGMDDASQAPWASPTIRRMLLGACLGGVALLGTWASLQWAPSWAGELTQGQVPGAREWTQILSGVGAIIGTILAALAGGRYGRRMTYFVLCLVSLASTLAFFQLNTEYDASFLLTVFLAGGMTAAFYGWLPLYLPELFPTKVRATGQGFAFNFGRILAAVGALQTGNLMGLLGGSYPQACSIMSLIYLVGMGIIWLAPETKGQPLPE